jgi:tetratricopeptide (TPR) repeat protein
MVKQALDLAHFAVTQMNTRDVDVATSLNVMSDYAYVLSRCGRVEQGILVFRKLSMYQGYWGEQNIHTLDVMGDFAHTLYNAERYSDAEQVYWKLFAGLEQAYGLHHQSSLHACKDLGDCYIELGEYTTASRLFHTTLEKVQQIKEHLSDRAQELIENIKEDIKWLQDVLSRSEDECDTDSSSDEESDGAEHEEDHNEGSESSFMIQHPPVELIDVELIDKLQNTVDFMIKNEFPAFVHFEDD